MVLGAPQEAGEVRFFQEACKNDQSVVKNDVSWINVAITRLGVSLLL